MRARVVEAVVLTRVTLGALAVLICVTLVLVPSASMAASSSELLTCQKRFESQLKSFAKSTATAVHNCTEKVVRCKLADEIDAVNPTDCLTTAQGKCTPVPAKVAEQRLKRRQKIIDKCGLIALSELEQFVAGLGFFNVAAQCASLPPPLTPITVATVTDLVDCLMATTQCSVERQVFVRDPRAQDSLTTSGIAASFPCVAP